MKSLSFVVHGEFGILDCFQSQLDVSQMIEMLFAIITIKFDGDARIALRRDIVFKS